MTYTNQSQLIAELEMGNSSLRRLRSTKNTGLMNLACGLAGWLMLPWILFAAIDGAWLAAVGLALFAACYMVAYARYQELQYEIHWVVTRSVGVIWKELHLSHDARLGRTVEPDYTAPHWAKAKELRNAFPNDITKPHPTARRLMLNTHKLLMLAGSGVVAACAGLSLDVNAYNGFISLIPVLVLMAFFIHVVSAEGAFYVRRYSAVQDMLKEIEAAVMADERDAISTGHWTVGNWALNRI